MAKTVTALTGLHKPGDDVHSISACVYGRGGTGKTTLLGTMRGKGLIVDVPQIEGGTLVLADKASRIDVVPITKWNDLDEVYWYLAGGNHSYKWVGFDSITAVLELSRRRTIEERDLDADPHVISEREWGKIGSLLREAIYRFRTLPTDVMWIAQERRHTMATSEGAEAQVLGPDVTPSVLSGLLPSMLFVARTFVHVGLDGSVDYRLRLGPHEGFYTKCRARPGVRVPGVIRNANLAAIVDYLSGKGKELEEASDDSILVVGEEPPAAAQGEPQLVAVD